MSSSVCKRALHKHLDFAFTRQLHCPDGCGSALADVDDPDCSQIKLHCFGDAADLVLSAHKDRNDQLILERLNGSAERHLVAWPGDGRSDGRLGVGARDQAEVMAIVVVHDELRDGQSGPAQFCCRREKLGGPGEDWRAGAVVRLTIECNPPGGIVLGRDLHLHENAVTDADAMVKGERDVRERATGPGNVHAEEARDQRRAPHVRARWEGSPPARVNQFIGVQYGMESGNRGEGHRIIRGEHMLSGCRIADRNLFVGLALNETQIHNDPFAPVREHPSASVSSYYLETKRKVTVVTHDTDPRRLGA